MRFTTFLFSLIFALTTNLFGQVQKPAVFYLVDGKKVTEEYVNNLDVNSIKSMDNGLPETEKQKLTEKYGDKVKDAFFIVITLYSDEEMKIRALESDKNANKKPEGTAVMNEDKMLVIEGDTAPVFSVKMLDGTTVNLSELKGKVVLLNFWATWCSPCLREFYEIPDKILSRFEGADFVFLPISIGEPEGKVSKKMEQLGKNGVRFNAGIDPKKEIFNLYAKESIPRNFLIDQDGKIVFISIGYTEENLTVIADKIDEIIKK